MLNIRFTLFTLILSVFALWFVFQQTAKKAPPASSTLEESGYSWQLFNSTTWQFDKVSNQPGSTIQADTLFYDDAAKSSDFTEPRVTMIQAEQTLFIRSENGHSINDNELELSGKVVLTQFDQPIQQLSQADQNKTLKTEYITYNSETQVLTSDQRVEITQPNATTTGTGLKADIQNRHYQLLSDVQTDYQPQDSQK